MLDASAGCRESRDWVGIGLPPRDFEAAPSWAPPPVPTRWRGLCGPRLSESWCRLGWRLFAAVSSPRPRFPVVVSQGGGHLLGRGLVWVLVSGGLVAGALLLVAPGAASALPRSTSATRPRDPARPPARQTGRSTPGPGNAHQSKLVPGSCHTRLFPRHGRRQRTPAKASADGCPAHRFVSSAGSGMKSFS